MEVNKGRDELKLKIIEKAWQDEAFYQELKSNPKEALKREFGINIPGTVNLTVLEETQDNYYLIIPAKHAASVDRIHPHVW